MRLFFPEKMGIFEILFVNAFKVYCANHRARNFCCLLKIQNHLILENDALKKTSNCAKFVVKSHELVTS